MGMRFSPRKNNSNVSCCVLGCTSIAKNDPTVPFHPLPNVDNADTVIIINKYNEKEQVSRRYAWEKTLKMKKYSPTARVCSLHFVKDDYVLPDVPAKARRLKKTAIPSVNLSSITPVTETQSKREDNNKKRTVRVQYRESKKKLHFKNNSNEEYLQNDRVENLQNLENDLIESVQENIDIEQSTASFHENNKETQTIIKEYEDKEVQVQLEIYSTFIKNKEDLNTMSSLSTFNHSDFLENVVKIVVPESASIYSLSKLSIKDRIILTFIKLKQSVSYEMLTVMFKISCQGRCRKIFLRMIEVLSAGLKCFIHWPDKTEVLKNIPHCFNDFSYVRAIIDVIEINIQCPKNLCCRIASYSAYKSSNTVRFMTAVTPAGLICFVSNAYFGRSSDKAIFEQSNLVNLLEKDDGLMTDKGFLIDDICLKHDIKLVRPPFLRNKKQFSREEALLNAKIAKARVHIERSN